MNYGELMVGGLKLMVFGMGMVYVFLIVMIGAGAPGSTGRKAAV